MPKAKRVAMSIHNNWIPTRELGKYFKDASFLCWNEHPIASSRTSSAWRGAEGPVWRIQRSRRRDENAPHHPLR